MKKKSYFPIFSLITFIVTMIINYGSMVGMFGQTQEEVSNLYRNFITPEPFTFSIWGVIYALVLIFLIYQFYLQKKDRYNVEYLDKLNLLFIVSSIFNIGWNIMWTLDMIAISTLLIFAFTIVLAIINSHILEHKNHGYSKIIPIAFSIYLGWLTVATVTNVAALLIKMDITRLFGIEQQIMAAITYIIVALLAGFIILKIKNPLFNLPIIWAFIGILSTVKNNPPKQPVNWALNYAIYAVFVALIVEMVYVFIKNNKDILPKKNK